MKEFTKEQVAKIVETVSKVNKSGELIWSKNKKLNNALGQIAVQLLEMCSNFAESLEQIQDYYAEFPKESDYNIVQYGNLLIYYVDIREFYKNCGYSVKCVNRRSNAEIWDLYKRQVGYVARTLLTQKF